MRLLTRTQRHLRRVGKTKAVKALIRRAKSQPCTDCGRTFPPAAMDFDHIPGRGPKLFCISKSGGERTFSDVEAEMFKCELVCAICHRIRTEARRKGAVIGSVGFSASMAPRLK